MVKYVKYDFEKEGIFTEQNEVSDELAELWIKNGNPNISDTPWPDLPIVQAYIVKGIE